MFITIIYIVLSGCVYCCKLKNLVDPMVHAEENIQTITRDLEATQVHELMSQKDSDPNSSDGSKLDNKKMNELINIDKISE